MKKSIRQWLPLVILVSLGAAVWIGWVVLQDRVRTWLLIEHKVGDFRLRVFGLDWKGKGLLVADSLYVRGPGLDLLLGRLQVQATSDTSRQFAVPLRLRVQVSRADIQLLPTPPSAPKTPQFPKSLSLPLGVDVVLDSAFLRLPNDTAHRIASLTLQDVRAAILRRSRVQASVGQVELRGLPARASALAQLDWGTDSVQLETALEAISMLGARDSVQAKAKVSFANLLRGSTQVQVGIESLNLWSQIIPGLQHAPALDSLRVTVNGSWNGKVPKVDLVVAGRNAPWLFLPQRSWNLQAKTDSVFSHVAFTTVNPGAKVDAVLDIPQSILFPHAPLKARGKAELAGIRWLLGHSLLPLDAKIDIQNLDLRGAKVDIRTKSDSRILGSAVFRGLHWNLDADVAPEEPWVVTWVPEKLHMRGRSTIVGRDSAGAAHFSLLARGPAFGPISGDSARVEVALDAHHIAFPALSVFRQEQRWDGTGEVDWTKAFWKFALAPFGDSLASQAVASGDFLGSVKAQTQDFPLQGLPFDLPQAQLPWQARLTAQYQLLPNGLRPVQWLTAALRARPEQDSLLVRLDVKHSDSSLQVSALQASLGASRVNANVHLVQGRERWRVETFALGVDALDLSRLQGVWPGIPRLEGKIDGSVEIGNREVRQADLRSTGLALWKENERTALPDLVLWGQRDTLHLGGWIVAEKERIPFRLTADHLFEVNPRFDLLAFYGDIIKLSGSGSLQDYRKLRFDYRGEGAIQVPGTEAQLSNLEFHGSIDGERTESGVDWSALLEGTKGTLNALEGNPLNMRVLVRANPQEIKFENVRLQGPKSGVFDLMGSYQIASKALDMSGRARDFELVLGKNRGLFIGSMDLWATPDHKFKLKLADTRFLQSWKRNEVLDVHIAQSELLFTQNPEWRKLTGFAEMDRLIYSRNLAQPQDLLNSTLELFSSRKRKGEDNSNAGASLPLLLDVRVYSEGDSVLIRNNLANAQLAFDLQASGPSTNPILNGNVVANTGGGSFGYLQKRFQLDEFMMEWNSSPIRKGKYRLVGNFPVRRSCAEEVTTTSPNAADLCPIVLTSQGTLEKPRLFPLSSQCAASVGDDGTVGATLALVSGCYNQEYGTGGQLGGAATNALWDVGRDWSRGRVNDVIREYLTRGQQRKGIFLPDSLVVTDSSSGASIGQMGLLAVYRLTPALTAEGEYSHNFSQSEVANNSATLTDKYALRLRYRIPFDWLDEESMRLRLKDRVVLQLELGESLDDRAQRETSIRPSIRYRWEFW